MAGTRRGSANPAKFSGRIPPMLERSFFSCLALMLIWIYFQIMACHLPTNDLDFHRGRNALAEARHDQARHYFSADLARHPKRLESLRGLGIAWASGNENSQSKAIETFHRAHELAPEDPEILWRLALAHHHRGEDQEALDVLGKVPRGTVPGTIPGKVPGTTSISFNAISSGSDLSSKLALLRAKLKLDDAPREALHELEKALSTSPDAPDLLALLAEACERLGDDDRALQFTRLALEQDPFLTRTVYLQAQIARRQGNPEAATQALTTWDLLRQLPNPGSPTLPASETRRILEALDAQIGEDSPSLRARKARFFLQVRQFDEAIHLLDPLLEENQLSPSVWLELGRSAQEGGRTRWAQRLFQHLLEQQPNHLPALSQQAFLAVESGHLQDAAELIEQGGAIDAHYAPIHFVAGLLALAQDETEAATKRLSRSVELAPWRSDYRLTLAELYLSLGDRDALDELFVDAPETPEIQAFVARHLR